MNLSRKVLTGVAVAATGLALSVAAPGSPAQADPGTCGVRNAGPVFQGATVYYVVRNRCGSAHSMRITVSDHRLYCQNVPAGGYAAWTSIWVDPNWSIQAC